MRYKATIRTLDSEENLLPDPDVWNTAPIIFDTASQAWSRLAEERENDEDDIETYDNKYSETLRDLRDRARLTEFLIGEDGTGTIVAPAPGSEYEAEPRYLIYSVSLV